MFDVGDDGSASPEGCESECVAEDVSEFLEAGVVGPGMEVAVDNHMQGWLVETVAEGSRQRPPTVTSQEQRHEG